MVAGVLPHSRLPHRNPCGVHGDQHLACLGLRDRQMMSGQGLRSASFVDRRGEHRVGQRLGAHVGQRTGWGCCGETQGSHNGEKRWRFHMSVRGPVTSLRARAPV